MPYRSPDDRKLYQTQYDIHRRKTHRSVKITLSLREFRRLQKHAKSVRKSVARTLSDLALGKLDEIPLLAPETRHALDEIVRLLRSSANNVNQIAHACNLEAGFLDNPKSPQEGIQILTQIHEGLSQMEKLIAEKLS